MNEEIVYRKIINSTNRTQIKNRGQYLNRVKLKWENKVRKINYRIIQQRIVYVKEAGTTT
jgi:hypothetical protein